MGKRQWFFLGTLMIFGLTFAVFNHDKGLELLGWAEDNSRPTPSLLSASTEQQTEINRTVDKEVRLPETSVSNREQKTEPQLPPNVEQLFTQIEQSLAESEQLTPPDKKKAESLLQELEQLKKELKQASLEEQRLQQDVQAKTEASEALNEQIETIRQRLP